MIFDLDAGRVWVTDDVPTAAYVGTPRHLTVPADPSVEPLARSISMVLEVKVYAGGMMPRALLGGRLVTGWGTEVSVTVYTTGVRRRPARHLSKRDR